MVENPPYLSPALSLTCGDFTKSTPVGAAMNISIFCPLKMRRWSVGALLTLLLILVPAAFAQNDNPVPLIDGPVQPAGKPPGGPGFTLTLRGAGFVSGSAVLWNGSPRATTFVSDAQLTASIPASDISVSTTASVSVSNPAPGGGISNVESLAVTAPAQSLNFAILPQSLNFYNIGQPITGDFNGDGKPDVAFTEVPTVSGPFSVCIALGNGDGTFKPPSCSVPALQAAGSSQNPGSAVIGDFNGDGKLDLAVPDVGDGSKGVSIFLGNGDGTLQAPIIIPAGGSPYSVATGDFNKDGFMDLAVVYRDNTFGILLGNGNGTFHAPVVFTVPIPPGITIAFGAITTGDFNLDGNLDLVLANLSTLSNDIYFAAGKGDGTFGEPQLVTQLSEYPTNDLGSLPAADLNGDGKLDLVRVTISQETFLISISVLLGNGDGTFQPPNWFGLVTAGPDITFSAPLLTDLNGDGKLDVVLSHSAVGLSANGSNGLWVLLGNGDGTFQLPTIVPYPAGAGIPMQVAAADLNGDGMNDLVAFGQDAQGGPPYTFMLSYLQGFFPVANVKPSALSFGAQATNSTSSPQVITLTNIGTGTLNFSGISIAGANSQDFSETNTCSATLGVNASCQISVTFTPTAGGTRIAALTINDRASGTLQTVPLTGGGGDFSLSATSQTSATVGAGQPANYTLALTPIGGFNQTVTLTCSGTPALSTCSVSPSSASLDGISTVPVTVTITSTAPSQGALTKFRLGPSNRKNGPLEITGWFLAVVMIVFLFWPRRGRFSPTHAVPTGLLLAAAMLMSSCIGVISRSPAISGTPSGNYAITVSAVSTVGNTSVKHDVNLTLVVK